jgi:LysR family transcriptional regulator, hydrogen peroxide-inducible genes activator
MEVHQLRYVVAIARTGSFSRAAGNCHVSQPSLSQQVRKLEDELGERLFERDRRRTRLTSSGERFVSRATRILDELAEAHREAKETHLVTRGQVSIGVLPTIAPYLLPSLVSEFTERYPGVQIVMHEDTTATLASLVSSYEVDLAIASLPLRDSVFEITSLFTEELLLAVPPAHPLAVKKTITSRDLESAQFVLMKEGHCLGDQALQFCHQSGVQPRVISRSSQVETIRRLVHAGLGISLIPKMAAAQAAPEQPVYRSLRAPQPQRTIVAFWNRRRPLSRAATAFLEALRETCNRQIKPTTRSHATR